MFGSHKLRNAVVCYERYAIKLVCNLFSFPMLFFLCLTHFICSHYGSNVLFQCFMKNQLSPSL